MRDYYLNDVVVIDYNMDTVDNYDDLYNTKLRKKMHKNSRRIKKIAFLVEENRFLRNRLDLMETLCGFKQVNYVIKAAMRIQSVVRGWILRKDKHIFDKSVSYFLNRCKGFLQYKSYMRTRKYVILIQSHFRGYMNRKTPLVKSVMNNIKYMREITKLEVLVLRLTSIHDLKHRVHTQTIVIN